MDPNYLVFILGLTIGAAMALGLPPMIARLRHPNHHRVLEVVRALGWHPAPLTEIHETYERTYGVVSIDTIRDDLALLVSHGRLYTAVRHTGDFGGFERVYGVPGESPEPVYDTRS